MGIIMTMENERAKAIDHFNSVIRYADKQPNGEWLKEQAILNTARVYYESKDYVRAVEYYAKVPRNSENWLTALFEAAWAFFLMEKPNNALGNIHTLHSPFFKDRFFPESYVLEAVSFLRLCQFDHVKKAVDAYNKRYSPVLDELTNLVKATETNPVKLVDLFLVYTKGKSLKGYPYSRPIFDALSRTDAGRHLSSFAKNVDKNLSAKALYEDLKYYHQYLTDLSKQIKLINAEILLGKVELLRRKLNIRTSPKKENFIGGMQALRVAQNLEYWPFEGEYWEDELGGYVYNIASQCKK